jgi:hypothetical protein
MWGAVKVTRDAGGVGVSPISVAAEERLAAKVRAFWGKQGYKAETRVELVRKVEGEDYYLPGVRSDMVNGFPRNHPVNARLRAVMQEERT